MKNALQFNSFSKESDNFETIKAEEIVRDWLEGISLPFDADITNIEAFEFRSRDGFSAHSHNRGGLDLFAMTSVSHLMSSGEYNGLLIHDWTEKSWNETEKAIKEENPNIDNEELWEQTYRACNDDYETIAWRIRVMYEGNGVLRVYSGYDYDAPYFRWNDGASFESEIKFKTLSGLKRQLDKLTKAVEASQRKVK